MRFSRRRFLDLAACAAAISTVAQLALAQSYPSRPVTMVIPFAVGGSADVAGRVIATRVSEFLGQQIIVENIGGAGGMIGTSRVAKAPPDGYQFVLGSVGTHAQNQSLYKNPLYNAATDFAPVMLGIEAYIWFALFLPKGTPAAIVRKLNEAAPATVNTPSVAERLRFVGGTQIAPERRTPEYLGAFVEREIAKWAAPIKASGVTAD